MDIKQEATKQMCIVEQAIFTRSKSYVSSLNQSMNG
jgi:hypothetical protein